MTRDASNSNLILGILAIVHFRGFTYATDFHLPALKYNRTTMYRIKFGSQSNELGITNFLAIGTLSFEPGRFDNLTS